jgi:hypothetical protein
LTAVDKGAVSGMIGATQAFEYRPSDPTVASDGVFDKDGHFADVSGVDLD